jgi:hypothetical protein
MNTSKLHVMKYKEAMASSDHDKWQKAVDEEHERMLKHNLWKPVLLEKECARGRQDFNVNLGYEEKGKWNILCQDECTRI